MKRDHGKELAQQRFIQQATDRIREMMSEQGVNQTQLAFRMGKSPTWVGQALKGYRTLKVHQVAAIAYELGYELEIVVKPR